MNPINMIDHTVLKATATAKDVEKLCFEAKAYSFASVCVNPCYVKLASILLDASEVKVCTVIGFPLGANTIETKVNETIDAVKNGALEVDMVINVAEAISANYDYIAKEIKAVVEAAKGTNSNAFVKVILETCYLEDFTKIKVCQIAKEVGADAVKTSTGFGTGGATVEDIQLMRETVGPVMCVKASGGVRNLADAQKMMEAGATRIGTSNGVTIAEEYKNK